MNVILKIAIVVPSLLVLAMSGCRGIEGGTGTYGSGKISVAMYAAEQGDGTIHDVAGWRFEEGVLTEILRPEPESSGDTYVFCPSEHRGEIYFMANASGIGMLDGMSPGIMAEDFLSVTADISEMTASGVFMSGYADLDRTASGPMAVKMTRGVSRIDISSPEAGVKVLNVSVSGLSGTGYVLPQDMISVPEYHSEMKIDMDFSESPLENGSVMLAYVPEQQSAIGAMAVIDAMLDGGLHRLEVRLPEILVRNNIYTVRIRGNGAGLAASVEYDGWDSGESAGSDLSRKATVDMASSDLGQGVSVSAGRDTVFFPYSGSMSALSVDAPEAASVAVEGIADGVDVSEKDGGFIVNAGKRMPGSSEERVYLNVYEKGVKIGRIVLVFRPSPIKVDGILAVDENGLCDFGRYVDGELGTVGVPYGKILGLEFGQEEMWMKAELLPDEGNGHVYRILGGWRPNDPDADGRTQECRIVISDEEGGFREEFVVRRKNWGLPVVRIGDTWWTKYNLRGDVRSFEDQITCDEDPVAHDGLLEYLSSVSYDSLLILMGDQYQGGNFQGLPLRHDGQAFYHEGMNTSGQNFGTLDPTLMAPDGYEMPGYEDYAFFTNSDNYNLGGVGTRPFNNRYNVRMNVTIVERDVEFFGHRYGIVSFYEFDNDGNKWVLFGLGHQWDTTCGNIAVKNLLMATYGNSGRTWTMEGYASSDRPGQNWLKFVANNTVKTRMIRCIKTPVEYIY